MIDAARRQLADAGRRMARDGLVTGTAGNISLRPQPDVVAITPTGMDYERIRPEHVCVMSIGEDRQLHGDGDPSSEWPMHRLVYLTQDAGAVVHTHSRWATVASTIAPALPAIHYYILRLGGEDVRVAPFAPFGSAELADVVGHALESRSAALLQNHGAITHGRTLEEAYARAELLEWLCEVYVRARSAGVEPRTLTGTDLQSVRDQIRCRSASGR